MTVEVILPRLLEPVVAHRLTWTVNGMTAQAAIEDLITRAPSLRSHLFDRTGRLRPHVLCFVDGEATRLDSPDIPVTSEIRFLQAVSGG